MMPHINGLKTNVGIWVVGVLLSGVVGYAGGQIGIAKELGKRPDRQEVSKAVTDLKEGVQRELDDVKGRTSCIIPDSQGPQLMTLQ